MPSDTLHPARSTILLMPASSHMFPVSYFRITDAQSRTLFLPCSQIPIVGAEATDCPSIGVVAGEALYPEPKASNEYSPRDKVEDGPVLNSESSRNKASSYDSLRRDPELFLHVS